MASAVVTPYDNDGDIPELLVITSSAEINGSLFTDTIVQKNCSVQVRGSVTGSLTIEPDADVLVDGSVYGKDHQSRRPARRQPQRLNGMCCPRRAIGK